MAQDLMKLAREADSNTQLVALMVPSTLRVYLSKTTPAAVRNTILARLENGEHVSRNDLHSAILAARSKKGERKELAQTRSDPARLAAPDLLAAEKTSADFEGDRSRKVAEFLIRRLSREDYDYVMDGMTWGAWNRVFVWMRAARTVPRDQVEWTGIVNLITSAVSAAAVNSR